MGGPGVLAARSTGSHCGGTATGWLASASLLATLGLVMCRRKVARKEGGDADEDEHAEARSVLPRLYRLRWGDLRGGQYSTVQGMGDGAVWNGAGQDGFIR